MDNYPRYDPHPSNATENQTTTDSQGKTLARLVDASEELTTDLPQGEESRQDLSLLQELLADLVFASGRHPDFTPLELKIRQLEHQIYDPEEVIKLLLPVISELLNRKVAESKQSIVQAIVPIIDEVIIEKTEEDKIAMIRAIADLIPGAIDQQVRNSPDDLVEAIAPAMGEIIKQQIRIEQDAMVDALYPVIGNTIAKYMQEVVREINSRVESTLTPAGIRRKIQARMQGVSEAELIFRESMPFEIKALFLIHKSSGLIISTVQQQAGESELGGDLMAGMLTAMRSFASSCVIENGSTSELKEIEYENFHIMMEVAGYCYLATIVKGETDPSYVKKLRRSLGHIILQYDRNGSIQSYSGDPQTINDGVHEELKSLLEYRPATVKQSSTNPPLTLFALLLIPLLVWGGWRFAHYRELKALQVVSDRINVELDVDPQLAVYPIQAEAQTLRGDRRQIQLTGKLPSERLKQKAATITNRQITQLADAPLWQVANDIVTVELSRDPEAIAAEVTRLTTVLNQDKDIILATQFTEEQVVVTGYVRTDQKLQHISAAFSQIPGVEQVLMTPTAKAFPIDQQFYFNHRSATLNPNDIATKLPAIAEFLKQYPQMKVRIIGYAHPNEQDKNTTLAGQRAKAVQASLIELGLPPEQLVVQGAAAPPANLTQTDQTWLSRAVHIERIMEKLGEN